MTVLSRSGEVLQRIRRPLGPRYASLTCRPRNQQQLIVVDHISYGDELVVAARKLSDRVPTEDYRYLAASVAIQHGTGGNLGRVLTLLSQVIRGRGMMRRKIKAMSAEGRISALILSCIP
jgi:tight adherence protein B